MRETQWGLTEQLIPVLRPVAKVTTIMCGESHVVLSFIYPVIMNVADNTLRACESDLVAIHSFKGTVRKEFITCFKLESSGLTESMPITACMLDPRFKHLKFPENNRQDTQMHLTQLVQEECSMAGNNVTQQQSNLHPSHVDALVFLSANQKEGRVAVRSEQDNDSESIFPFLS